MPDLKHTLQGNDLGFLRIVAEAWGIELNAPDAYAALPVLVTGIRNQRLFDEVIEALPPEAKYALQDLLENEGRISWALFTRRYGELRAMGAGRRDRVRPDLKPVSAVEMLWYRAIIGKAFLNTPPEPQEYAYIPDDLLEFLQPFARAIPPKTGRAASPQEYKLEKTTSDRILDHACTLLAALRLSMDLNTLDTAQWSMPVRDLLLLLHHCGMIDGSKSPKPEATRAFLEASRGDALIQLTQCWMESKSFNELHLLPGLKFEGEWQNNPLQARQAILERVKRLPSMAWWNLPSFINAIKEQAPDFQRPAGDYDSWFIRSESDGSYLRGYGCWDEVDGALIRYIITGPMFWLGFVDLATPEGQSTPIAFRLSMWSEALLKGKPPLRMKLETDPIFLSADGSLRMTAKTPRSVRYQVARFCAWEEEKKGEYHYRLTPASLERAQTQGLRPVHLIGLLRKHGSGPIPPTLLIAMERWEKFGVEANVEKSSLLRVASAEILAALRKTREARYLGEALNDTTIIIKAGGEEPLRNALAELGYLAEVKID
jgi:hypothetical protein